MAGRSLRFRLTFWYTGFLAATLIGFSFTLYLILSHNLQRHHDDGMTRICQEALALVRRVGGCMNLDSTHLHALGKIGHTVNVVPFDELDDARATGRKSGRMMLETRKGVEGEIRVASAVFVPPDGSPACLIEVTDSLGNLDSTLNSLRILLLALVPLALMVATFGGVLILRKTLRPLQRIVDLTRKVEATNLGLRLDLQDAPSEIALLAGTFNQMIGRLESSFTQMKQFAVDASHELRTPLTVLTSSLEVALQKEREPSEYCRVMKGALAEVGRLTRIVEDLLIVAQAEAGKLGLRIQEVALGNLLRQSIQAIRAQAEAGGLTLQADRLEEVSIDGDSRCLRQIFDNLLDNAMKYTPPGGSVSLFSWQENGKIIVEVADTGIGIPENDLQHIFNRFHRVDPARGRNEGGIGLGLSIAYWAARFHGGRIEVKSVVGKGSRFLVILPKRFSGTREIRGTPGQ